MNRIYHILYNLINPVDFSKITNTFYINKRIISNPYMYRCMLNYLKENELPKSVIYGYDCYCSIYYNNYMYYTNNIVFCHLCLKNIKILNDLLGSQFYDMFFQKFIVIKLLPLVDDLHLYLCLKLIQI
ncbi:MAG TPA: hypothetical protein VLG50_07900 [Candidatus Saccharimonadales bacterium]|nr:hypothetical protein [Candidatus Saccharimonadales bacterium]